MRSIAALFGVAAALALCSPFATTAQAAQQQQQQAQDEVESFLTGLTFDVNEARPIKTPDSDSQWTHASECNKHACPFFVAPERTTIVMQPRVQSQQSQQDYTVTMRLNNGAHQSMTTQGLSDLHLVEGANLLQLTVRSSSLDSKRQYYFPIVRTEDAKALNAVRFVSLQLTSQTTKDEKTISNSVALAPEYNVDHAQYDVALESNVESVRLLAKTQDKRSVFGIVISCVCVCELGRTES